MHKALRKQHVTPNLRPGTDLLDRRLMEEINILRLILAFLHESYHVRDLASIQQF